MATSSEHPTSVCIPVLWAPPYTHSREYEYFSHVHCEYHYQGSESILDLVDLIRHDVRHDARTHTLGKYWESTVTVYEVRLTAP